MQRNQTLRLEFTTPTIGYDLKFVSVFESKDKIVAVLALTGGSPCQMLGEVRASLVIMQQEMYAKAVEYYVLTKKPKDWSRQEFTPIKDVASIEQVISKMQQIYKAENASIKLAM